MFKILVFPCGSEIGLEVYRALQYSAHVHLFGSSSIEDHGKFVYQNYIGGLPFLNEEAFIPALRTIVQANAIDAIYPTMDSVIAYVKANEEQLGCKIIASEALTTAICLSKKKTYALLKDVVNTPFIYENLEEVKSFPVFLKPEIGYGSRGAKKAETFDAANEHLKSDPSCLILEYLPGKEYTVDCFTNYEGDLMFVGPRRRQRISNGISVSTATMTDNTKFKRLAYLINSKIKFNGAWFFQVKERADGTLVLMEIASRLAGSSAVYRAQGVNFALLSVFNAFEIPVSIQTNQYAVTLDRALDNRYTITPLSFSKVYVDFDDTVIIRSSVNTELVKALYHFINQGKTLHLITKHIYNIRETLLKYRLQGLFDEVILLNKPDQKYLHIDPSDSIYIDDSFAERQEVKERLGIPVFSPDMVEALI